MDTFAGGTGRDFVCQPEREKVRHNASRGKARPTPNTLPTMSDTPLIWINAGETSGDLHGAALARALAARAPGLGLEGLRLTGMAGPAMRAAGVEPVARTEDLSVMGFTEVIARLGTVISLLSRIRRELARQRPDALVCIDAPAFNFRVIKHARKLGIPVHYYISPKLWAWRPGRAAFIRDNVERMLCIFPFERDFYARHGVRADYVGHPQVEELTAPELRAIEPDPDLVGVLPGSRRREIASLTPVFARAAAVMCARRPGLRFAALRAPGVDEAAIRAPWEAAAPDTPLEILAPENRYAAMRSCAVLLAASGTVTLESALLGVPTVVAYKLSALTFALARRFVRVPFVSLPNLILRWDNPGAGGVFPELLQDQATGENVAEAAMVWLDDPAAMAAVRAELAALPGMLGPAGATDRAAGIVLEGIAPACGR